MRPSIYAIFVKDKRTKIIVYSKIIHFFKKSPVVYFKLFKQFGSKIIIYFFTNNANWGPMGYVFSFFFFDILCSTDDSHF